MLYSCTHMATVGVKGLSHPHAQLRATRAAKYNLYSIATEFPIVCYRLSVFIQICNALLHIFK